MLFYETFEKPRKEEKTVHYALPFNSLDLYCNPYKNNYHFRINMDKRLKYEKLVYVGYVGWLFIRWSYNNILSPSRGSKVKK